MRSSVTFTAALALAGAALGSCNTNARLWYTKPAGEWTEALPIGNGRVGAMVFGNPVTERMQVNEESVYSGGYRNRLNPDARETLPGVRDLLAGGRAKDAEKLAMMGLTATPQSTRHYETLGEMMLEFEGTSNYDKATYERWLDLKTAVAGVKFDVDGTQYRREMFASHPDNVIVHRITTSGGSKKLSFNIRVHRPFGGTGGNTASDRDYVKGKTTYTTGGTMSNNPIEFAAGITVRTDGTVRSIGQFLVIEGATEATAFFTAATTYRHDDPVAAVDDTLAKALARSYDELLERHLDDYRPLIDSSTLEIHGSNNGSSLPTDQRLTAVQGGTVDPGLAALQYQYGRYMLIASAREDTLPANLQGIWCADFQSAWGSKYTVNINLQMNYWPAEVTSLSSLHNPLFDLMDLMYEKGKLTARDMYNASGWMTHHNTDLWGDTAPEDRYLPATYWTLSSAWLSTHILEHYAYTGDKAFLVSKLDILSDAIRFYLDTLQPYELDGATYLVTAPSVSPENTYKLPDGSSTSMAIGPTCDFQILRELFVGFIDAVGSLGSSSTVDTSFIKAIEDAMAQFPPAYQFSTRYPGVLQEWIEDFEEAEPGHRHITHLYALHPGSQIPPPGAPGHNETIWKAVRATLDYRLKNGGAGTGWSRAWTINWFARLLDADAFESNIQAFFKSSVYKNLFDAHPPFQADGNWGFTAGVAEALLQSHMRDDEGTREVWLLPTVPKSWSEGKVTGLVARGGFVFDIEWAGGRVSKFKMRSKIGGDVVVRFGKGSSAARVSGSDGKALRTAGDKDDGNKVDVDTKKDGTYEFEVTWS